MIGAAAAGVMLWLATTILPESVSDASLGGYWAAFGLVAIGGLVMALSQLLGGWTKWGWPRVSSHVFLVGFVPTLIVGGWMLAAHEPQNYWLGRHVRSWSGDIGIDGLVDSLGLMLPAIAFGSPEVRSRNVTAASPNSVERCASATYTSSDGGLVQSPCRAFAATPTIVIGA